VPPAVRDSRNGDLSAAVGMIGLLVIVWLVVFKPT
jgi:hypothetical protein